MTIMITGMMAMNDEPSVWPTTQGQLTRSVSQSAQLSKSDPTENLMCEKSENHI